MVNASDKLQVVLNEVDAFLTEQDKRISVSHRLLDLFSEVGEVVEALSLKGDSDSLATELGDVGFSLCALVVEAKLSAQCLCQHINGEPRGVSDALAGLMHLIGQLGRVAKQVLEVGGYGRGGEPPSHLYLSNRLGGCISLFEAVLAALGLSLSQVVRNAIAKYSRRAGATGAICSGNSGD